VAKLVSILRKAGISVDFNLKERSLAKQLEYADSLKIPYVAIVGKREVERGLIRLRDMERRVEKEVSLDELLKFLKS
jgi:histidyl-tRNA synthetase